MMKIAVLSPLALAMTLAACTNASGPTFNVYRINPPDGAPTYRVECHGLMEGPRVCQDHARKICHDQVVRPIEMAAPFGHPADARTLIFQCGALPPESSMGAAPIATPVAVKRLDLAADANFEFDNAELTPGAKKRLDELLAGSQGLAFSRVDIDGYTDARGSVAYNSDLSERWANEVAQYLRAHGLQGRAWNIRGHGSADPIATNFTELGRAGNRRVEISLLQ